MELSLLSKINIEVLFRDISRRKRPTNAEEEDRNTCLFKATERLCRRYSVMLSSIRVGLSVAKKSSLPWESNNNTT